MSTVELTRHGTITVVQFSRPEKANALDYAMLEAIESVALACRDDETSRVVIFTGAGKHFSAGADLRASGGAYQGSLSLRRRRVRIGERVIQALLDIDQITIAACNGAAMGGGACMAFACDFRIGADDCVMGFPEIDIGLNLMWQSLPLVTHLVGPARAKRLVIGGERVPAQTLLSWGVLDEVVPRDELLDRALALGAHYAAKPPVAAQMIKRSVNQLVGALDRAVMHMDADQNLLAQSTEDRKKAVEAYLAGETTTFDGN